MEDEVVNNGKLVLGVTTAVRGKGLLCPLITLARVMLREHPKSHWTARTRWTQYSKDENQNEGPALFPQMNVQLFVLSITIFPFFNTGN